jgi:ribonuclease D
MKIRHFIRQKLKKKRSIHYVSNKKELNFLDKQLSQSTLFGLDTEFDWRTTYFPKLSLIQISIEKHLFLIDCLKVNPEKVLKKYLENKNILKIFHSARSDTTVLSKCLNSKTKNVFDIQLADKILSKGDVQAYGKIVKKFFGVLLKKGETNSNWLKRPLSENQINYALDDVDYLLEIYNYQKKNLVKLDLLKNAFLLSKKEADLGNQPLKKLRLKKNERKFSKRSKEIFMWREEIAELKNIPPAFIFKDRHLLKLSKIESTDTLVKNKVMAIIGDTYLTEKFIYYFL